MVNRHAPARMRFARSIGLACVVVGALGSPVACGGSNATGSPVPAVSETVQGQLAFRALSERWHAARPDDAAALSDDFRRYLTEYGAEDQSRLARAYLAWLDVTSDNLLEARELIEVTRRGPPGRARDFALVAEAALLLKHGHAHEALKLLRPLQGKLVDPTERYYATQVLVQSAMGAKLYAEGLSQAVTWIQQAKPQQRESVRQTIRGLVSHIPTRYLERALETQKPDPSRNTNPQNLNEQRWLYQVIGEQLATIAVQQKDATLAKRVLVDSTPVGPSGNRAELLRLASGSGENASVAEHTIGLVLNTANPMVRRRSSQTMTGLSLALEQLQSGIDTSERVRVLFTDDTLDLAQGLAELAASGASVLATGFSEEDATIAARYAARVRIPVLLFVRPRIVSNYAFVLGVGDQEQQDLAGGRKNSHAAIVSELECEVAAESPKATGFPLAKWALEGRTSLYLLGDAACSQRVLAEMRNTEFEPQVWFGLESAHLWPGQANQSFHALTAGHFPLDPTATPEAAEFAQLLGHQPTWFETLGRDAAQLLVQIMRQLPRINTNDDDRVSSFHAQVHAKLLAFESTALWSSPQSAFDENLRLRRSLTWQ